ncbi:hypothetical protein, partial [Klebsiella pneumoniae]|uniref:hypothetical protein n=1 Tax=Klebsiella pneumoniae TaxID=573 RepID=UPI001D0EB3F2
NSEAAKNTLKTFEDLKNKKIEVRHLFKNAKNSKADSRSSSKALESTVQATNPRLICNKLSEPQIKCFQTQITPVLQQGEEHEEYQIRFKIKRETLESSVLQQNSVFDP